MAKGKTQSRRGRPPLPPESGKRHPIGIRTTKELHDRVESAAKRSGRSIAQEIEFRLERSFAVDEEARTALDVAYGRRLAGLLMLIGRTMRQVGSTTRRLSTGHQDNLPGRSWFSDPWAFNEAVQAANRLIDGYRPTGDRERMQTGEPAVGWKDHGIRLADMILTDLQKGGVEAELEHVHERLGAPINPPKESSK